MFVLIIVIHYYTYMVLMITVKFCCAYSLYTSQISSYKLTDLINLQWLPVHQWILLEVIVLTYNLSGIFSIS